jgi:hypothetical protein
MIIFQKKKFEEKLQLLFNNFFLEIQNGGKTKWRIYLQIF